MLPLQNTGLGEDGLGWKTSPKLLVHGGNDHCHPEVLPVGSGHNHWNNWSMVTCKGLVMKATRLHRFQSKGIQA